MTDIASVPKESAASSHLDTTTPTATKDRQTSGEDGYFSSDIESDSDFNSNQEQSEEEITILNPTSKKNKPRKYDIGVEVELTRQRFGIIRYRGEVQFGSGTFYGIELTRGGIGKHSGTVDGQQYFVGPEKKCIFVTEDKFRRVVADAEDTKEDPKILKSVAQGRATSSLNTIRVGRRYLLEDNRYGICSYVGRTAFAPGEWIGISLDAGEGRHDGSVHNKRYFQCRPGKGIFVRKSRLVRDMGSSKSVGFLSRIDTTRRVDMVKESINELAAEKQHAHQLISARRGISDNRIAPIRGTVLRRAGTVGATCTSKRLQIEPRMYRRALSEGFEAGDVEEWQPPNYDITPDHGSYLKAKPMCAPSRSKNGVAEKPKRKHQRAHSSSSSGRVTTA